MKRASRPFATLFMLSLVAACSAVTARPMRGAAVRMSTATPTSAERVSSTWERKSWIAGYATAPAEESYTVQCSTLPDDLVGTFFRNAPAKFEVGGKRIMHPFDADGMLSAVTFDGQKQVHYRNRFVRTRGFVREKMEGKMLYAGQFGNPKPVWEGGLQTKNLANTNVVWWGSRLLALWEGGKPHLIDHLSLATSRESDLAGQLRPSDTFSAHPRIDPTRNRLVNFAYQPNPLTGTKLTFWEFASDFRVLDKDKPRIEHTVPGFSLSHDFALTPSYYIIVQGPTRFNASPVDLLLGKLSPGECIAFEPEKPALIWLFPRNGAPPIKFEVPSFFSWHHANAYEDENGAVVLDTVRVDKAEFGGTSLKGDPRPVWETIDFEEEVPLSQLYRYTLDVKTGKASSKRVCTRHVDFVSVNPTRSTLKHRFVYGATGGLPDTATPFKGVVKIDTSAAAEHQVWLSPHPNQFVGEPIFAPRTGATADSAEDDGYILLMLIDGQRDHRTSVLVLRADDVAAGPIATVELDSFLPHGLHGTFVPGMAPSRDDIDQATTLMNLFARKSREWNKVDGSFSGMGFKAIFQKGVDGR